MIPWINFAVLITSSCLFTVFYVKSVGLAALEKSIGPSAYQRCATYRLISSIFMFVVAVNDILYYWFPLPLPLPRTFPWQIGPFLGKGGSQLQSRHSSPSHLPNSCAAASRTPGKRR